VHAVVARSTSPSQNVQSTPGSEHSFGSCDVEKVHAVVARSTFGSQNSDRFLKLGCGFAWQVRWILHLAKREQKGDVSIVCPQSARL
jgi:hypothetical protein